jgi:membrane-associated protease RseP (regulator of RpoE activity)
VKLQFPFFVPSLQIGIFGSITRFLGYPKDRKALFDVSIAGPFVGFVASLACIFYGLMQTAVASPEELATFPGIPAEFFKYSLLLYELSQQYLPAPVAMAQANAAVVTSIHPFVAIGICGMLTNAFNFMPLGRLDGGRVVTAIAGRDTANRLTTIAILGLAVSFFTSFSPILFFWALTVVFLQRGTDIPPENDVTPVSTDEEDSSKSIMWFLRLATLVFCIGLSASMILPVPMDQSTFTGQSFSDALNAATNGASSGATGDLFFNGGPPAPTI